MDDSIAALEIDTTNGAGPVPKPSARVSGQWWRRPIPLTLGLSVVVTAAYVAFERIGTTANANSVEYTRNYAGGFLAVGTTEDQPGFIVLSALEQDKVKVTAAQAVNRLAGNHTVVELQTPRGATRIRLRGPQVILVSEDGAVEKHSVEWTLDEFNALREAADCSHEAAIKKHRCGAPFTDLQEALAKWPGDRVPERVRVFLAPFADHPTPANDWLTGATKIGEVWRK